MSSQIVSSSIDYIFFADIVWVAANKTYEQYGPAEVVVKPQERAMVEAYICKVRCVNIL